MKIFVYPGSFDPVTYGHIDIIERASKICDKLIVAVLMNNNKKPCFSLEERIEMLKCSLKSKDNVVVDSFSGMLVDYMKTNNANTIIKGLRAVSDFEYELQMALMNKTIDNEIETLFMMTNLNFSFLSSSIVREIAMYGGNIESFVPNCIVDKVLNKFLK